MCYLGFSRSPGLSHQEQWGIESWHSTSRPDINCVTFRLRHCWPGEKSTIIWSVQPLNPLPVSYLCHCCWWQIGDNKSHKMFIVPGFSALGLWAECPSGEQYSWARPWTRSSVSVTETTPSHRMLPHSLSASVSLGVTAALRGKIALELQCEDCQPGQQICLASLGVRYRSVCPLLLCFSAPLCHLRRTRKQRLRFKEFRNSSFMKFKFSKRTSCWLK